MLIWRSSGNGQPLEAVSMTGLATAVSGNTLYQYYQAPDGNIMENSYDNGDWSLQQGSNNKDVIVTSEAGVASPLAAIVYPHNGETYRQVFFISSSGKVCDSARMNRAPGSDGLAMKMQHTDSRLPTR